jgi:hypothetical protein
VALSPIDEFASSLIADPATGLVHDAETCVTRCGLVPTAAMLAVLSDPSPHEAVHGFQPCERCFGCVRNFNPPNEEPNE